MSPPNVTSAGANETSPPPYHEVVSEENAEKCDCDTAKEKSQADSPTTDTDCDIVCSKDEETVPLNSDSLEDPEVVVPPDGGWGWAVVFASFMCNMIVDGIIFSFGAFLKDISESFEVTKAHVTLAGSLMSGFYLMAGPFVSALANRYGFRIVAVAGSIMGAAAFAISYFATSVQFLCISYGVLGGIGFGFIYVPSVITVGFYFEKWRALATGIAVCGSGIGTFLFSPICQKLVEIFGWREALLLQGGIVLTCVIFGLMFRPLKPTKLKDLEDIEEKTELIMDPSKLPPAARLKMEQAIKVMKRNSVGSVHENQISIPRLLGVNNNSDYPRVSDVYHTIHHVPQTRVLNMCSTDKRLSVPFIDDDDKPKKLGGKQHLLEVRTSNPQIVRSRKRTVSETHADNELTVNRPMYRDDIFFGASLTRLPQYTSRTSVAYNLAVTRVPTKNDIEESGCKICPEAVRRTLATMLDISLFKSPTFLILAIGGFFTMMGFYVPFMYLIDRAVAENMDVNIAGWLVASIGIANTIGRVLCGILSSFPGVNALFVTNAALTIGGIATIFSGLSLTPEYQFFYTVVFGLAISTFASLRSIVVVDLLGLEKLTNAFGLLLLFQGVAAIIGTPLAGAFHNATGSYDYSFYLSGTMLLLSAVMCYPLNYVNKWEIEKANKSALNEKSVPV